MAILPPEGSISIALAAVYSVAFVLLKETAKDHSTDQEAHLYGTRGIRAQFVTLKAKTFSSDLMVDEIYLLRHKEFPENPFMVGGIGLNCRPRPDPEDMPREFGPNPADGLVGTVCIYIKPPHINCLSKSAISVRIPDAEFLKSGRGLLSFMSDDADDQEKLDQDYAISATVELPPIDGSVVPWFRQSLAAGKLNAYLVEEDGRVIDIPASFWRTEKAETALIAEHPISINIDGERLIGQLYTNFDNLNNAWSSAYKQDHPSIISIAPRSNKYSPYLEFMIRASNHLGLINGMVENGSRLKKDEVERWLSAHWPAELGPLNPTPISYMATFLRHPSAARGGNVKVPGVASPARPEDQRSDPETQL